MTQASIAHYVVSNGCSCFVAKLTHCSMCLPVWFGAVVMSIQTPSAANCCAPQANIKLSSQSFHAAPFPNTHIIDCSHTYSLGSRLKTNLSSPNATSVHHSEHLPTRLATRCPSLRDLYLLSTDAGVPQPATASISSRTYVAYPTQRIRIPAKGASPSVHFSVPRARI
jgi:hypothetical protein